MSNQASQTPISVNPSMLFAGHSHPITLVLEIDVDAGQLVSVDSSGVVCLWETSTGNCITRREVQQLACHAGLTAAYVHGARAIAITRNTPSSESNASGKVATTAAKSYTYSSDGECMEEKFERMMGMTPAQKGGDSAKCAAVTGPKLTLLSLDSLMVMQTLAPCLSTVLSYQEQPSANTAGTH